MQENKTHYLVALLLGVVGLLIILIFVSMRSQAETGTATSSVSINNYTPTVDSVTISTESGGAGADVTLLDDSTVTVYVHGEYTDANGCDDVYTGTGYVSVALAPSGDLATCNGNARDSDQCYASQTIGGEDSFNPTEDQASGTCTFSNCVDAFDQTANFECTFPKFQFWADGGTWGTRVIVYDGTDTSTAHSSETATVNTLTAIGLLDSSVNYGSMPVASTSGAFDITIENTGNDEHLDIDLSGTLMTCTVGDFSKGDIPGIGAQRYFLTSGTPWLGMTALTGVATKLDTNVSDAEDDGLTATKPTKNIYWRVKTPTFGVSGSCSSTVTISANAT